MNKKDLTEYKKKYHAFRHHAWAGLGFLSVVVAIRLILFEQAEMLTPIIVILAIYILVALIFTYRYRAGLTAEVNVVRDESSIDLEKEKLKSKIEKERLKIEKKKAKAKLKTEKKNK
jgi:hypothetical protein